MPGNNRIISPGSAHITAQYASGPLAITIQKAGGCEMIIFGGLTKLEYVATELAKATMASEYEDGDAFLRRTVDSAAVLLKACNDVQSKDQAKPDAPAE
jgi:hypothetical protein